MCSMSSAPSHTGTLPSHADPADGGAVPPHDAGSARSTHHGVHLDPAQARAIDLVRAGHSVTVTGTIPEAPQFYEIPIAEAAAGLAGVALPATSLLVFATKTAAHKQLRFIATKGLPGVRSGAYDGDAGRVERARMRDQATVVFTNPEMLHGGLLPHHDRWSPFLSRLRYIVIDELHTFRGDFGSHMAHIVRRLRRVAHHYGATPTFVCCSAATGTPVRLPRILCGVPFVVVRSQPARDAADPVDGSHDRELTGCSLPDPADPWVLDAQLRCAAHELPLTHADERYWPETLDDGVRRLALADQVVIRRRRCWLGVEAMYSGGGWPARDIVALR
jgi:hypothetical protein